MFYLDLSTKSHHELIQTTYSQNTCYNKVWWHLSIKDWKVLIDVTFVIWFSHVGEMKRILD